MRVSQRLKTPLLFLSDTPPPSPSGNVTISGNTLTVSLSNKANGNVVADAVRIERINVTIAGEPRGLVGVLVS